MHIQKIRIVNFRNFRDFTMNFQKGLNVIIGANNAGKTGLLKAINILNFPEFSIEDLNKNDLQEFGSKYREDAPQITIEYTIRHTISEDNTDDESILRLLSFVSMEELGELRNEDEDTAIYDITAKVRAICSLDVKALSNYKSEIASVDDRDFDLYLSKLKMFERKYEWTFTNMDSDNKGDKQEATNIFDIRYIGAERTSDEVRQEAKKEIKAFAEDENVNFQVLDLRNLVSDKMKDIAKDVLEKLAEMFVQENNEIGLAKGYMSISQNMRSNVSIGDSYVTEVWDTRSKYSVPLEYNGLGYNNLINIYMLLKLTEIRKGKDFKVLLLEEPEAHLHPALQYKLFKYLSGLDESNGLNQQIFVTTHSSNISAVAGIDNMYLLAYERDDNNADCTSQSLREQFVHEVPEEIDEDEQEKNKAITENKNIAKKHLMKFLDVTRSDMLFADKVILVEGIAEKLLMPKFMEICEFAYEDEHVSIVEIGGKHFGHFVELFNGNNVTKKVLCLTDKDFNWMAKGSTARNHGEYSSYEPEHIISLKKRFSIDNFKIKTQSLGGQTFEDELFLANIADTSVAMKMLNLVASDYVCEFATKNELDFKKWSAKRSELRKNSPIHEYHDLFSSMIEADKNNSCKYEKIFFAQLFLKYAQGQKGELALSILVDDELAAKLVVPSYIKEGIEWLKT